MSLSAKQQLEQNVNGFFYYKSILEHIICSLFKWKNLPEGLKNRMLERMFLNYGGVSFVESTQYGYAILPFVPIKFNIYGEAIEIRVTSFNGTNIDTNFSNVFSYNDFVLGYASSSTAAPLVHVTHFANKLYNVTKAWERNLDQQVTPIVALVGNKKQVLTYKNILEATFNKEKFFVGDKLLDLSTVQVLDLKTEYLLDKLSSARQDIFNEFLSYIGIKTTNIEKKERLVSTEAESSHEVSSFLLSDMLREREEFCSRVNEKFGYNLCVELNFDTLEGGVNYDTGEIPHIVGDSEMEGIL